MKARIDYTNVTEALRGMHQLEHYIHNSGLEESLVLVKMRASQINGCAYCLDVHSKDTRALGETEQRLYFARRVGGGAVLLRARTRGARAY